MLVKYFQSQNKYIFCITSIQLIIFENYHYRHQLHTDCFRQCTIYHGRLQLLYLLQSVFILFSGFPLLLTSTLFQTVLVRVSMRRRVVMVQLMQVVGGQPDRSPRCMARGFSPAKQRRLFYSCFPLIQEIKLPKVCFMPRCRYTSTVLCK